MYMYDWVTLLPTRNYHNIVYQLYSNIKYRLKNKWFLHTDVMLLNNSETFCFSLLSNFVAVVQLLSRVNSLQAHGLQHARLPCPSPSPWVCSNIELAMPSNHPILCHPLGPSIIPSIRVCSNESALCIKWPKYWSFSFNNSPSNEYSGLISFKINWFNLLAVQETLESSPAPQFKSINSSALSLLMVQLSNLYMTIGKTIALTMGFLSAKWYFCFLDLS